MFKVVDLFCGTGALSYGLTQENDKFVTVAGIDINKPATDTAQANHKSAKIICGDIEEIVPEKFSEMTGVHEADLVVGGPPCQGFSSIRPSRGKNLDDPRNHLYKSFIEYVEHLRPKAVLMENVIGLINASKGNLLKEIIEGFEGIGFTVDWRVLNAANYGVPQKRERLFLIGYRGDEEINFPKPTHFFDGRVIGTKNKPMYIINREDGLPVVTLWDAISDLESIASGQSSEIYKGQPLNEYQRSRRNRSKNVSLHSAANHSEKMLEVIQHSGSSISALPSGLVTSGYSSCYSRLTSDEPSTTITVKFTSPASSKCIHPFDDRAITPREAARIQGFDDDYHFCGSKTDIASQIGNAVPPLLGGAFAGVLSNYLGKRGATDATEKSF